MRLSPLFIISLLTFSSITQAELSLDSAIQKALSSDHWNQSSVYQEQALRAKAIASAQLPDPKLRLGLANLPTDSFDFQQENMTQLQLGVSQQFPRGNSLELSQQQWQQKAAKSPLQRQLRAASVKLNVSQAWLKLHQSKARLAHFKAKQHIFNELVAVSRANYRSGKALRHEVLDAEVKLTQLKDRMLQLEQLIQVQKASLQQWLTVESFDQSIATGFDLDLLISGKITQAEQDRSILKHPQIKILKQNIVIEDKAVDLADQAYKPAFKLDANYGYRADHENGRDRADLFSVAVTMDLPLFPEKRQDQHRRAAVQQREASKAIYLLKARELRAELAIAKANLQGYEQRLAIYNQAYLKQLAAKRKSALRAYASAESGFKAVSIAAMEELEAQQQQILLEHQVAMATAKINFYFAGEDPTVINNAHPAQGGMENE